MLFVRDQSTRLTSTELVGVLDLDVRLVIRISLQSVPCFLLFPSLDLPLPLGLISDGSTPELGLFQLPLGDPSTVIGEPEVPFLLRTLALFGLARRLLERTLLTKQC